MNFLWKWLKKNRRLGYRMPSALSCTIRSLRSQEGMDITVFELSEKGIAFSLRTQSFSIGESVELVFHNIVGRCLFFSGTIVSQKIYHTETIEDLKHAVYRFSVHLDQIIPNDVLKEISVSSQESC